MTAHDWLELGMIAFITGSIGYLIWRGGAANPVGTGGLNQRVNATDATLNSVLDRVGSIETHMEEMEGNYARVSDIVRLEYGIQENHSKIDRLIVEMSAVREDAAERRASASETARQLAVIYEVIVSKGMNA